MKNHDVSTYSKASILLHWAIALIVMLMLMLSFFLDEVPKPFQSSAYMLHKSFGLTVLFLMIVRILWIMHKGRPTLPVTVPVWEQRFSRFVQYSFYLLLLAEPLCGWIMSMAGGRIPVYFGLYPMPLPIESNKALATLMKQSHKTIAWCLITLLILHIAGALKHHFIDKDTVLKRMLPWG